MATIKVKGYEFNSYTVRDSFNRKAVQFANNIIVTLRKIGIPEDDIDIKIEPLAIRNVAAAATWYIEGMRLYYSYDSCGKFVENLYVVSKVIELEVASLIDGTKKLPEFLADFTEDKDIVEIRKEARKTLGIDENSKDLDEITRKYKELAKEHHPDMEGGNSEAFKKINRAHKILKRELE